MGLFSVMALTLWVSIGAIALVIAAVALLIAIAPPALGVQRQRISKARGVVMLVGLFLILAGIAGGVVAVLLIALNDYQEGTGSGSGQWSTAGALVLVVSSVTLTGGILAIRKALYRGHRTER